MAVQIARIEHGHLLIDTETFGKILNMIGTMPVAVVAVSGPLHDGKYNIINQLLRHLAISHDYNDDQTKKAVTTEPLWEHIVDQRSNEILLWPEPLVTTRNGQSVAVLLMVIHGTLDNSVTMADSFIFSFGCLLSSVMLYNVSNDLSEDTLRFLHMTVANAKVISQQNERDTFGKLLFVVNNWKYSPGNYGYGLHNDQKSPSMQNFKQDMLNIWPHLRPEARVVRQEILTSFQNVTCYLMQTPSDSMDCPDKGNEPFLDYAQWVFAPGHSISKKVNGKEVTGFEYKALMVKWAGMFARVALAPTSTVAEANAEQQTAVAFSVALKYFKGEMTSVINGLSSLSDDQLREIHAKAGQDAVNMFKRLNRSTEQNIVQNYMNILNEEIQKSLSSYLQMNAEDRLLNPTQMLTMPEEHQPPVWFHTTSRRFPLCIIILMVKSIVRGILYVLYKLTQI